MDDRLLATAYAHVGSLARRAMNSLRGQGGGHPRA
jgi:hypothetical protein